MKIFTRNKVSKGIKNLIKLKKVKHFNDKLQFSSYKESVSYMNRFSEAQVSEIAALAFQKR